MTSKMETQTFFWLLLLVSVGFLWVLKPFFGPIFWACAVAIIFTPVQQWLLPRFNHRRNVTALATLGISIIIVVIPFIFVASSVVSQGINLYQKLDSGDISLEGIVTQVSTRFPFIQEMLLRYDVQLDELQNRVTEAAMATGKFMAERSINIGHNAFQFILNLGVMIYLTFFMLRDGKRMVELVKQAVPLGEERKGLLFAKFAEVTRATVKGNIVIAAIQGSLGGIIFWFLGIPAAVLWGVVMAVVSLIPAIGAVLIWGPVAIYLFAVGNYVDAIILTLFGAVVIGLVDNILRPILVGRDTKLPDYLVLTSTLGGIALVGINGFVIGPLIAALFMAFWGIFIREFNHRDPV
ncbi:AI-2E family transporter [Ectothiorhodospira lacustris]|uniref:AI-2E family transporter n=1 Tax=Ectothiorhodospira lacustris TaxID=2899127 RepID=UPI001EE7E0DD|nr:AI-2E family transporter [Ectothiorhodospira lacustris]MCG5502179.1 AI-2E family transporter [Ectothiorhodospira lacustris]MCG5511495.1 AI-2E family transporter [Ectothiorhodospira lacustris]MCG5523284.1 AI-2E family transporter [Ectothiorhodospira lacustris]